jgi:hypothetical protein
MTMKSNQGSDRFADEHFESLVEKLDVFTRSLPLEEQLVVRAIIDNAVDPIERLRRREGCHLLDEAEAAFLEQLESRP